MEIQEIIVISNSNNSIFLRTDIEKRVQIKLNIEDVELKSTNFLELFLERLKILMPSLYSHVDQYGIQGYLFKKEHKDISIPAIVAYTALELQLLSGMDVEYISIGSTDIAGVYNLEVGCLNEDTGTYALLAAVELVEALLNEKLYFIRHDIDRLKCLFEQSKRRDSQSIIKTLNSPYFKVG